MNALLSTSHIVGAINIFSQMNSSIQFSKHLLNMYDMLITQLDAEDIIIFLLLSISHSSKKDKYLMKKHSIENKNRSVLRCRFSPNKKASGKRGYLSWAVEDK